MKALKRIGICLMFFALILTGPIMLIGCGGGDDPSVEFTIDGTTLTGFEGDATKIVIPDNVTKVEDDVFVGNETIEEVVIPDSVVEMGWEAFRWCTNLKKVHIGSGLDLNDIITTPTYDSNGIATGRYPAFFGCCYNLEEITVSEDNQTLKSSTTKKSLLSKDGKTLVVGTKSLEIPTGVEVIGQSAFFGYYNSLNGVATLTIPNTVKEIGGYAFYHLGYYNTPVDVVLPASLTEMKEGAFRGSKIKSVTYNSVIDIADQNYLECTDLKTVNLMEGIENIGTQAFSKCSLEFADNTLTIPSTVKKIGRYAFHKAFSSEKYNSENATYSKLTVSVPNGVTYVGGYAFASTEDEKIVYESLTLPKTLDFVGSYVLSWTTVEDFVYSGDVADWCGIEFDGLSANPLYLQTKDSVGEIYFTNQSGAYIFEGEIVVPASVTRIGKYAFPYVDATKLTLTEGLLEIGANAFQGLDYTSSEVILPDSLQKIEEFAFSYASVDLIIPAGLEKIEDRAFNGLSRTLCVVDSTAGANWGEKWNAKSVNSATQQVTAEISVEYGFDLNWLKTTKLYPHFTFSGYTLTAFDKTGFVDGQMEIIIPEGTKEIKSYVFHNCGTIKKLVLPSTLESIGTTAFGAGSTTPTFVIGIEYNGTVDQWAQISFANNYSNPMLRQNAYKGTETKTVKFSNFDSTTSETLKIGTTGDKTFEISQYAFVYLRYIDEIVVGSKITGMQKYAFEGTYADFYIASSVSTLGVGVFSYAGNVLNFEATAAQTGWNAEWNKNYKSTVNYGVQYQEPQA